MEKNCSRYVRLVDRWRRVMRLRCGVEVVEITACIDLIEDLRGEGETMERVDQGKSSPDVAKREINRKFRNRASAVKL